MDYNSQMAQGGRPRNIRYGWPSSPNQNSIYAAAQTNNYLPSNHMYNQRFPHMPPSRVLIPYRNPIPPNQNLFTYYRRVPVLVPNPHISPVLQMRTPHNLTRPGQRFFPPYVQYRAYNQRVRHSHPSYAPPTRTVHSIFAPAITPGINYDNINQQRRGAASTDPRLNSHVTEASAATASGNSLLRNQQETPRNFNIQSTSQEITSRETVLRREFRDVEYNRRIVNAFAQLQISGLAAGKNINKIVGKAHNRTVLSLENTVTQVDPLTDHYFNQFNVVSNQNNSPRTDINSQARYISPPMNAYYDMSGADKEVRGHVTQQPSTFDCTKLLFTNARQNKAGGPTPKRLSVFENLTKGQGRSERRAEKSKIGKEKRIPNKCMKFVEHSSKSKVSSDRKIKTKDTNHAIKSNRNLDESSSKICEEKSDPNMADKISGEHILELKISSSSEINTTSESKIFNESEKPSLDESSIISEEKSVPNMADTVSGEHIPKLKISTGSERNTVRESKVFDEPEKRNSDESNKNSNAHDEKHSPKKSDDLSDKNLPVLNVSSNSEKEVTRYAKEADDQDLEAKSI